MEEKVSDDLQVVRIDLHNHLGRYGTSPGFNRTIDSAEENLGAGGVFAIANCGDERYERFVDSSGYERRTEENFIYVPARDILVVRAQEVFTEDGDLLVVGLPRGENIEDGRSLEYSLDEANDKGGINIAIHGFFGDSIGYKLIAKPILLKRIDAIEVFNAQVERIRKYFNKVAKAFYEDVIDEHPHLGAVSFTDGHGFRQIGISSTGIPEPDITNSETLNDSLRWGMRGARERDLEKKAQSFFSVVRHIFEVKIWNKLSPVRFK